MLTGKGVSEPDASIPPAALDGLGDHEVLVTYTIDPAWLHDPSREFPVTLDPSACIGATVSPGCTINNLGLVRRVHLQLQPDPPHDRLDGAPGRL